MFNYKFRTGLIAVALLATLPAMGIIAFTGHEFEQHARQDCLDQARKLTGSLKSLQQGITQEAKVLLMTLASLPSLQNHDAPACDALFADLLDKHPELSNILFTDTAGIVRASALPALKGASLADRKYFQDAVHSKDFSVGEFNIGRTSRQPILVYAYPVKDRDGSVIGVVGMSFLLEKYHAFLENYDLPPNAQVSIFDHAGLRMFTYPDNSKFRLGDTARSNMFQAYDTAKADDDLFYDKRLSGEDGLFTFARLRIGNDSQPYMVIVVAFSLNQAFGQGRWLMVRNLVLTSLAGLTALAVALLIGQRSMLRGLDHLVTVAGRLGRLDLSARASTRNGSVEVRRLGEAFNVMAQTLEAKQKALEESAQALDRTRNMLANILESMPSAVIGLDAEGCVTHWNKWAVTLSGTPAEKALGKPLADAFAWLAPEVDQYRLPGRGDEPLILEKRPFDAVGQARFVDVLAYPLVKNGHAGVVLRVDDVTTRIRMEELLLRNEKMSTVGSLAGGMAHEINNPLSGILQSLQIIVRRLAPELPANIEAARQAGCDMATVRAYLEARGILGFLDSIKTSGERAAKIVKNMLGFIRKSASGKIPQNLAELVDRTLEIASSDYDLKKKYDFRKIAIVRDYASDMPPIPCSPAEIEQVLYNLLVNAAQAMALQGEPHAAPRLILRVYAEGEHGVIEVHDNGPGMEEQVRRRIFEPLFSTKAPGEGTGLGLSVAYFIVVNTHGGEIQAICDPGQGTRFVIRLPYRAATTPAGQNASPAA